MYTEQYIQTRKIEMNWNILLAVVLLPFSLAYSEYSKNVKMLSAATFDAEVIKNERAVMVKFFAPYCGHCKKMIPAYSALADSLKDLVDIAAIDCTNSANEPICSRYHVSGYPTLKLFVVQESETDKIKRKKIVLDYNNGRSTAEMTTFIKHRMHQFIFQVSDTVPKSGQASKWIVNFESFFSKGGNLPKLLLFRSDTKTSPTMLFRALSIKYHYKIAVGEVSTSVDPNFASKFNLTPGKVNLIYFPEGNEARHVAYDGKIGREEIFAFLDTQLATKGEDKMDL